MRQSSQSPVIPAAARGMMRFVLLLLALVVAASLGALWALMDRERLLVQGSNAEPLFPAFPDALGRADSLTYTFGEGIRGVSNVTLTKDDSGTWRVMERLDYPADEALVKRALLGLAGAEILEPRTANPEWHAALGLRAPEDLGEAVRIRVDAGDRKLASVLVGSIQTDAEGAPRYMRRDGEDQSYLVRGDLPVTRKVVDWLNPAFVTLAPGYVNDIAITEPGGMEYRLAREEGSREYRLVFAPEGWRVRDADRLNDPARVMAGLRFDDVVPAGTVNFDQAWRAVFRTGDGLLVTLMTTGAGNAAWARVSARAGVGAPEAVQARARDLEARFSEWIYKLPFEQAAVLTRPLGELLEPAAPDPQS